MPKHHREPTKFQARLNGGLDVDPIDSDDLVPGDTVVVVGVAKVRSVGLQDEEKSGEAVWVAALGLRQGGIVRDQELIETVYGELGMPLPDPQLPFPTPATRPAAPVAAEDDDEDDDEDDLVPAFQGPPEPTPLSTDEALRAFLSADVG